jgi:hypothetical protein
MTEAEWLASTDSRPVWGEVSRKVSDRKVRLLICACCRRAWDLLVDSRSREAVEVAERYADGSANRDDLIAVRRRANAAYQRARKQHGPAAFRLVGASHLALQATSVARRVRFDPRENEFLRGARERKEKAERKARCGLVRDLVRNPFCPSPPIPSSILAWKAGTVRRLAEGIYQERQMPAGTFDTARIAVLADALLDAGCTDEDLIAHCRSEGSHVRGCWAVDLILGKE